MTSSLSMKKFRRASLNILGAIPMVGYLFSARGSSSHVYQVSYVTDVEGNLDYFQRFVKISKALRYDDDGKLHLNEGYKFVFGGDLVDKGTGDIRLADQLLSLHERHPHDVFFIGGNRDYNKMRLTSELDKSEIEDYPIEQVPGPYFVPEDKRITPVAHLKKVYGEEWAEHNTRADRFKYMLIHTMGCPDTFEKRREELKILGLPHQDEDVVQSYMDSVRTDGVKEKITDGFMTRFMDVSKLAVRIGDTLFIHGGMDDNTWGKIPGHDSRTCDLHDWIHGLNDWKSEQVNAWKKHPTWDQERKRGGEALVDYTVPGGNGGATVVYNNWLQDGHPKALTPALRKVLSQWGIRKIITGHQPHGDCPTPILAPETLVVMADTSYSDMGKPDNRGVAVSEVLITTLGVEVNGVLKDGQEFSYKVNHRVDEEGKVEWTGDTLVGRELNDGRWVKAKLKTPREGESATYVLCLGKGFRLDITYESEEKVKEIGLKDNNTIAPAPATTA